MFVLTSSLLVGFIRLCLITLMVFYLYKKLVRDAPLHFLDFIVQNWFRYGTAYLLVALILTQLNAFNLFNCFFVFFFLIVIDNIGLINLRYLKRYFNTNVKVVFLHTLRNIELKVPAKNWVKIATPQDLEEKKTHKQLFLVTLLLVITTFFSRYFFINFDNYSLSDPWIIDLSRLINLDNQQWFGQDLSPVGELAILNFYAKIADIAPEIALHFASIFESIILSVIVFWTIHKLTASKFIAPLVTGLMFSLVYVFSPLNVYYMLQTNSILMALTFALPLFVFVLKPQLLQMSTVTLYTSFAVAFFAISLTDLFVFFVVTPVFLLITLLVSGTKQLLPNLKIIGCYGAALAIYFLMYGLMSQSKLMDFDAYLMSSLVSMSAYSYFPQLVYPLKTIVQYMQYLSWFGILLGLGLQLLKRGSWTNSLAFLLFFNLMIILPEMKISWVDVEKIKVVFIVFFPLVCGFCLAMLLSAFEVVTKPLVRLQPLTIMLVLSAGLFYSFKYQDKPIAKLILSDTIPKEILNGYDKIAQIFYANTYTVVNTPAAQVISTNRHGFMNYEFFLSEYLVKDALYFQNKKNKLFLAANPNVVLPNSVLVFVSAKAKSTDNGVVAEHAQLKKSLLETLQTLKNRGRKVIVFYQTDLLTVYEIINEPGASKIHDLVFTKR
jgi:hypothetical protein